MLKAPPIALIQNDLIIHLHFLKPLLTFPLAVLSEKGFPASATTSSFGLRSIGQIPEPSEDFNSRSYKNSCHDCQHASWNLFLEVEISLYSEQVFRSLFPLH